MAKAPISVTTLTYDDATRKNIPKAEHQSIMHDLKKDSVYIAVVEVV